jgi:hypothetical protein
MVLLASQNDVGIGDLSQIEVLGLPIEKVVTPYPQVLLRPMRSMCCMRHPQQS